MSDSELNKRFLYPNGTLKNKLNILDADALREYEYIETARREYFYLKKAPSPNPESFDDLVKIHKFLFQSIYDWAGCVRDYNLSKNGYTFLEPDRFGYAVQNVNNLLAKTSRNQPLSVEKYAIILDELNYIHPFREGNGRATKLFIQAFAANHLQVLFYPRHNHEMIKALNDANIHDISNLIQIENTSTKEIAFQYLYNRKTRSRGR